MDYIEYVDLDDATDEEDRIVSVRIRYKHDGVLNQFFMDVRESEILAGQRQGFVFIGIEFEESEEDAIAREEEAKKKGWMNGWLVRTSPEKYQVLPRKWVAGGDKGGRWLDADPDTRLRVIVEWKKASYGDGMWFVEPEVVERELTRMEKLSDSRLRFKVEVKRPKIPLSCGPLTGRSRRAQPPLMGTFSETQMRLLDGKTWPARRLAEMCSSKPSQRLALGKVGGADSSQKGGCIDWLEDFGMESCSEGMHWI